MPDDNTASPAPAPVPAPAPAEQPHSFLTKALKALGKLEHFTEEEVKKLYELIVDEL